MRPGKAEFAAVPSESVDYAVMEKCPGSAFDIRMVALNAGWNDLGAWEAVWQVAPKDAAGNAQVGDAIVVGIYLFFIGLNVFMWSWWQKRGKKVSTELATSTYGRPLVKKV